MKKIVNFSDYLNEEITINEEYRIPNDSNENEVAKEVANFDFKEVDTYINSKEFKAFYDDSELEDITNGKFTNLPTNNIDKQTGVYQLIHYVKNININITKFDNLVRYAIKLDDLFYGTLLIRSITFYNPELKKDDRIEKSLQIWVKYYNL